MKIIFLFISGLLSFFWQQRPSIYTIACATADGRPLSLNAFKGKKLLFVVLPSTTDTSFMNQLVELRRKNAASLHVVAIPSPEQGYTPKLALEQGNQRAMLQAGVTITQVMSAGEQGRPAQGALLQWLTNKEKNGHFNIAAPEAGQKFFVDEKGVLYAVLGAHTGLNTPIIQKIVNKPVPVTTDSSRTIQPRQ